MNNVSTVRIKWSHLQCCYNDWAGVRLVWGLTAKQRAEETPLSRAGSRHTSGEFLEAEFQSALFWCWWAHQCFDQESLRAIEMSEQQLLSFSSYKSQSLYKNILTLNIATRRRDDTGKAHICMTHNPDWEKRWHRWFTPTGLTQSSKMTPSEEYSSRCYRAQAQEEPQHPQNVSKEEHFIVVFQTFVFTVNKQDHGRTSWSFFQ